LEEGSVGEAVECVPALELVLVLQRSKPKYLGVMPPRIVGC